VLEGIKLTAGEVGKGLSAFLGDKEKLTSAAVTLSAVALGVYTARVSKGSKNARHL
jgi:ATPase family AAA domain-containing protein 3A/B